MIKKALREEVDMKSETEPRRFQSRIVGCTLMSADDYPLGQKALFTFPALPTEYAGLCEVNLVGYTIAPSCRVVTDDTPWYRVLWWLVTRKPPTGAGHVIVQYNTTGSDDAAFKAQE